MAAKIGTGVLCSECGYFCWHVQHESGEGSFHFKEMWKHARDDFQKGKDINFCEQDNQNYYQLYCYKHELNWKSRGELALLRKVRKCPCFIKYYPAFSPNEHKELERDAQTRNTVFKATIIGAAIGALAAICAQLLYALFSN